MAENTNGREETLTELGSRFFKTLVDTIKRVEGSPDLYEDIDDAYIEKIKHYVHQWDQIDFNDLTNAISSCLDFENDIDEIKSDFGSLASESEEMKSEVSVNSQTIEDIGESIKELDRRVANIERIFNVIKLALTNDYDGD